MKIALSQEEVASLSAASAQTEVLSQAIEGCRIGDWEAKRNLERLFTPLILMLAERRAGQDVGLRNKLVERGREGLYRAAKRFPRSESVRRFRIFALDRIEQYMDKPPSGLAKLFL
jgi:DNA-directed RNA polymerase specialized sigma subunit